MNVTSEEHRLASFASVLDAPLPSTHQGERRHDAHLGALPVDASVFNCGNRLDSVSAGILRDRPHERLTKQWGD